MRRDEIEQTLVDKLTALAQDNNFEAYETDIPVGKQRDYEKHASPPYVIIDFGNTGQQSYGDQGITGTRDNLKWESIVFMVVSNNPATNRRIVSLLRDTFDGFIADPTWGEMVERLASPLYERNPPYGGDFNPPRYSRTIAYVVDVDA